MSALTFTFGGAKIRTAGTHEAPLFCAADVCAVLALGDVRRACERLDQDDVSLEHHAAAENKPNGVVHGQAIRGVKRSLYVNESGLYALILGSNKPEAKVFKRWVTSEVLPTIRKQGYYSILEAHQAKQTERLLAEIFPALPKKAQPVFRGLIAALLRIRGEAELSGNPPWARSLASKMYGWTFKVPGQQAFRRTKNAKPSANSTDYSMLSADGEAKLKSVVEAGCHFAKVSFSWRDWREKMDVVFGGKMLQAPLFPQLPENK